MSVQATEAVTTSGLYQPATTTGSTADKEMFLIEGARHIETYWVPKYTEAALAKLVPFFGRTL